MLIDDQGFEQKADKFNCSLLAINPVESRSKNRVPSTLFRAIPKRSSLSLSAVTDALLP
jgi:hypothetical protein